MAGPEVGPGRKWQGLGPALSIASAATEYSRSRLVAYGSVASWNVPTISGRGVKLLGDSIMTSNNCPTTADSEDVLGMSDVKCQM